MNETQIQKNITKTVTTTTTNVNNNIGSQNRGITSNMNAIGTMKTNINSNIDKNYSQGGYEVTQYTTTTNQHQTNQIDSHQGIYTSNLMNGPKLVDVLNNEINKNEFELQEKMKNQNIIKENHSEHLFGNNGTIIQRVEKTQTIEYGTSPFSILHSENTFKYK